MFKLVDFVAEAEVYFIVKHIVPKLVLCGVLEFLSLFKF